MIDIRELEPSDNEFYRALWLYGITEQSPFFRVAPQDDPAPSIPTRHAPDSFTVGAFAGHDLIGIVSCERDSRAKLRHKALLFRMLVHPHSAGQGVGKALLQHVIVSAKALRGLRYIYLTVLASNTRAIHLYSSVEFREFAREPGGVLIGGQYVDELQMARQLVST